MEFITMLFGLAVVAGGLAAFGLAAVRWGIDSRDRAVDRPFAATLS